ncbi:antibiotic biosynthesis monooxygenase [Caballeronia glebae]|uniref:Antibiotic biosynthesis monooxygenase n=2 Tax=Caballeronia glebae TaxID=1777143 RepID=A0A158AZ41_9BURK|nr:antibiotic biosynthesis monooxygenase [Caballeronia glebae]
MFVVAVEFVVKSEHAEAFERAVIENAEDSLRQERDCLVFDVCRSITGTQFFLYEVYEDADAFEHHLTLPHFLTFSEGSKDWVCSKKVNTFALVGDLRSPKESTSEG